MLEGHRHFLGDVNSTERCTCFITANHFASSFSNSVDLSYFVFNKNRVLSISVRLEETTFDSGILCGQ